MKNITFATKDNLKQPSGSLVVEAPQGQDHVLGGLIGPDFDVLVPDGHWAKFAPMPELQKNRFGDTFMCVSFSNNNAHEFIYKQRYDEIINFSDIFLGVGSGTVRGYGNSKRTVAEWKRKNGYVTEGDYPYTADMTLDQVYKKLPASLLSKALKNLDLLEFGYKWTDGNKQAALLDGLKYSPLQVDVQNYKMANGLIVWNKEKPAYIHEVIIFDYEPNKSWWVYDSENDQYLKYAWDYPFGSPLIHSVKKKMKIQLFKKTGQAGIAVKTFGEASMIVFSGGSVIGENLFKSIYGVTSFKEIPITEVKEWPYPIRHVLNCNPYR